MPNALIDLLIRTGSGTPIGNLLRCCWVPALSASEFAEPDYAWVRARILGQKLLAFRDTLIDSLPKPVWAV